MLGAIAGDIIGSVHEFARNDRYDFELFVPKSSPTDDSLLTSAVAQALLKGDRDYRRHYLEAVAFSDKHNGLAPLNPAYGTGFLDWARNGGVGQRDSFGNGSAMRVSPVAWAFESLNDVLEHAVLTALPSHAHPEGVKGAVCTAECVWTARRTRDAGAVRAVAERHYGALPALADIRRDHVYNERCQDCVPQALAIAVGTDSFESAVRFASSIRGDADTLAAIAGSVSQVLWGIPDGIRERALSIAGRCYPGMDKVVLDFEARFGAA